MKTLSKTFLGMIGIIGVAVASAASARVFVNVGVGSPYYVSSAPIVEVVPAGPVMYVSDPRYGYWHRHYRSEYYPVYHHHHYHRGYYR